MSRFFRRLTVATALCLALGGAAVAYQVQPMSYILSPSGQGAMKRLIVSNTDASPLDLELQAFSVDVDVNGKRTFTPADDSFAVFPPQATLQPGATQSFQVRYIGDPNMSKGKLYVVRVHQANVTFSEHQNDAGQMSRMAIAMNFNTTVVVQPTKLLPNVSVAKNLTPGEGGRDVALVTNNGDGVADLTSLAWQLTRDGKTTVMPTEAMKYGETAMLPPGQSRLISLDPAVADHASLTLAAAH